MGKQELGAFIRSRREQLRPADVGLPELSRRRTPGLRRQEVADRAQISAEYYIRIEQGRGAHPSAEVLSGIRTALGLNDAESEHMYLLAGAVPGRPSTHRRDVSAEVHGLIGRLPQTAAIVTSAVMEVLAWNYQATRLFEDFSLLHVQERNLARMAFLENGPTPNRLYGLSDLTDFRDFVAKDLRAAVARYPADRDLRDLVDDLQAGSEVFSALWGKSDVRTSKVVYKDITHPKFGVIALACNTIFLGDRDQQLVMFTPQARSAATWLDIMDEA